MMFWLALAALTLCLVAWIAWPLFRPRGDNPARAEYDVAVYYDQLQELDRDRDRGLIDATQADAARGEIERRLLNAGRDAGLSGTPRIRRHVVLAVALALLLPLASVPLYFNLGNPGLPAQPFATREAPPERTNEVADAVRGRLADAEAQTRAAPDDPQAWLDLGRLRLFAGNLEAAETALARARSLDPDRPEIASAHGEALARLADGLVTPAARAAFLAALEGNADDPRARYFLALADYQSGREQAALDAWSALAKDAPADAPWLATVVARVTETARDLGHDPADWLPEARGPSEADIAAARNMDAEERQEMIRGMVDGLAARLEDEPDDLAGWRMLARAGEMLGDPAAAAQAYARAIALDPDHPETLLRGAITAAESGDTVAARANFVRLRDLIPPDTDVHRMVSEAIERLDADNPTR